VGLFVGLHKPNNVNDFFEDFVEEVLSLNSKIEMGGKEVKLVFRCLIADTPAKAFVCGIPSHSSKHGCSKCTQVAKQVAVKCGKKTVKALTYETVNGALISDEDFASRIHKSHHAEDFRENKTPLEKISFNMITQVPLDGMHLIDLGVMKKILIRIIERKTVEKTPKKIFQKYRQSWLNLECAFQKNFQESLDHWMKYIFGKPLNFISFSLTLE